MKICFSQEERNKGILNIFNINKTKEAIEFIREHEPEEGYFLGFSGGKDSMVLYDLTKRSKVKFQAYYSFTTIDPPELVKFIKKYYLDVKFLYPNYKGHKSFFGMIQYKGFPTKFTRWCCNELKKYPSNTIPLKHRLFGIRSEESSKRAKRPQIEEPTKKSKWNIYKPLFYWLEWEIWEYIEENSLPYCSLYDEGFHRLGCVVCPFLCSENRKMVDRNMERWPKYYKSFEKSMYKLWISKERERQLEKGYATTFEEFLDDWYKGFPNKNMRSEYKKYTLFDSRK